MRNNYRRRVFASHGRRVWQAVTLQCVCWKARVILMLLASAAIFDWLR